MARAGTLVLLALSLLVAPGCRGGSSADLERRVKKLEEDVAGLKRAARKKPGLPRKPPVAKPAAPAPSAAP